MNYTGITKSTYVGVEDEEALGDLVDEAKAEDWGFFLTYWDDDHFAIGSDASPIYIEDEKVDEFLTRLGESLSETMVVRSVGFEGMRYPPDAWQWIVRPDGTWEHESLSEPDD